ncbi:MAG TPA: hypothetical protein PKL84_01160 [Candidatus Hydrogenedentes bacterium]|nr:hypothetical protein [Candidatus Hydrogenedentota bacterium]
MARNIDILWIAPGLPEGSKMQPLGWLDELGGIAEIEGIQARVVETIRSGIADVLGRDPFISVVDQGAALALPALPDLTPDTLAAVRHIPVAAGVCRRASACSPTRAP